MRISAGELKGKRIISEKVLGRIARHGVLRPTSSKVRESVFNIIGSLIDNALFVDLYAGTGAVGMEAMSRGADAVYFVEADKKRVELLGKTLEGCGCRSKAYILKGTASDFIKKAIRDGLGFDIVFLDPPYYSDEIDDVISLLSGGEILRSEGIVIAEHYSKKKLPAEIGRLRQKKAYKYGDTMLTLFGKV